mmetsp:Transcript_34608/g.81088  ORF Transcript_34608/g.81088 Transcript_34608/m.81088 type:complete len:89 (+) Transcript_34608:205-471(+)
MVQGLQARFDIAVLYMSVDLTPVAIMAHQAAFMRKGKLLENGQAHELLEAPKTREARVYIQQSRDLQERTRGKNLLNAYQTGESVFNL